MNVNQQLAVHVPIFFQNLDPLDDDFCEPLVDGQFERILKDLHQLIDLCDQKDKLEALRQGASLSQIKVPFDNDGILKKTLRSVHLSQSEKIEIMNRLVSAGLKEEVKIHQGMNRELVDAITRGEIFLVKGMIESGLIKESELLGPAENEDKTRTHTTALHLAIEAGRPAMVAWLIEKGASVHREIWSNKKRQRPLMLAIENAVDTQILNMLFEAGAKLQSNVWHQDDRVSLIKVAIDCFSDQKPDFTVLKWLHEKGYFEIPYSRDHQVEMEPLVMAASKAKFEIVRFLIKTVGVNPDGYPMVKGSVNMEYHNPICYALYANGKPSAIDQIIDLLIESGAMVGRAEENLSWSPIFAAVENTNMHWLHRFLELGANVHHTDHQGYTAIHLNVSTESKEILEVLMQHGLSVRLKNEYGDTAADLARMDGQFEFAQWLDHMEKQELAIDERDVLQKEISQVSLKISEAEESKGVVTPFKSRSL